MKLLPRKWFALLGLLLFLGVAVAPNIVGEKEELPDLIITDIHVNYFGEGLFANIGCWVENIGSASTSDIPIKTMVRRLSIGLIPIERNYTIIHFSYPGWVIEPGEYTPIIILKGDEISGPGGFWSISSTVNYDGSIEELNYANNQYNATIFHIGGFFPPFINKFINP